MTPERLLHRILADSSSDAASLEILANQLLAEFHRGYDIENLRTLLRSRDGKVIGVGVWIASELGTGGKTLMSDVSPLLDHSLKKVRFFALDCILLWAGSQHKAEVASAISRLNDGEAAVRWKALDFLSRASREQLEAGLFQFETTNTSSKHIEGLRWLLDTEASNSENVIAMLQRGDDLMRKYAVVAAVRMIKNDRKPLSYASSVEDDPDIKDFAESSIRLFAK